METWLRNWTRRLERGEEEEVGIIAIGDVLFFLALALEDS